MTVLEKIKFIKNQVLENITLFDVVSKYVDLKKKGTRFVAKCPFHEEKTPSFYLFEDRYYCFGCKANGDIINFIQNKHNIGFIDALRFLCNEYHLDCRALDDDSDQQYYDQRNLYKKIISAANDFFIASFKESKKAIDYIKKRKLNGGFNFGYAPNGFELLNHLKSLGFSYDDILKSQIVLSKNNNFYPFFRDRLMIQIKDHKGDIVAFAGRSFEENQPKYINSKESQFFKKSQILFGYHENKKYIKEKGFVYLVEGYMDLIQLANHKIYNSLACLGTAVSKYHLSEISKITNKLILLFDGDAPGQNAILDLTKLVFNSDFDIDIEVYNLPKNQDPDDFISAIGKKSFIDETKKTQNLFEFALYNSLKDAHYNQIPNIIKKTFVPWLRQIKDNLKRSFLITKIFELTGMDIKTIESAVNYKNYFNKNIKKEIPINLLEILGMIFYCDNLRDIDKNELSDLIYLKFSDRHDLIFIAHKFIDLINKGKSCYQNEDLININTESEHYILDCIKKHSQIFQNIDTNLTLKKIIKKNNIFSMRNSLKHLKIELSKLKGDQKTQYDLLQQANLISRQINSDLLNK